MTRLVLLFLLLPPVLAADSPWESGPGFRRKPVAPADALPNGFTLLTQATTAIAFTNTISEVRVRERQNIMNGAGVALGDFDRDGRPDIFLCNKEGPSALYRNLGDWRFEDVTLPAGVACVGQSSSGATFADLNGDGWLDLIVTSFGGPNACFLNLTNGSFTNITAAAGLQFRENMTSLALGDIDGDADLDLYLNNFGLVSVLRDGASLATRVINGVVTPIGRFANRVKIINGEMIELGEPDFLFSNNGHARFSPLPWPETFRDATGHPMAPPPDFGLAVQMRDINGDGFPDLYVCNDFQTPDRMWLNDGKGKFRAPDPFALRTMSYAAMGVDFADIDRDGDMDFIVVEMLARDQSRRLRQETHPSPGQASAGFDAPEDAFRNTLYLNNGDGSYSEIARLARVAASDWSWCPIFLDVDLDGFEDLLVTNGNADDTNDRDAIAHAAAGGKKAVRSRPLKPLLTPNVAFRNRRDLTFELASSPWNFDSTQISHGMALADLDGDGDQDVVVNCWNAPPLLYRNNASNPRVLVRLNGRGGNTQGVGAMVTFRAPNGFSQSQEIISGGRYMSGDDPTRTFACLGPGPFELHVNWRSGRVSALTNVAANSIYEIDEPGSSPIPRAPARHIESAFQDVSARLAHTHASESNNDFDRQPLLPRSLSQKSPSLTWVDLNNDGHDDLIIGPNAAFSNTGVGPFSPVLFKAPFTADESEVRISDASGGSLQTVKFPPALTPGPIILLDFDSDGDLDLFLSGTSALGQFPQPASALLFSNDQGQYTLNPPASAPFAYVGCVNAAVAADLNGDGWIDLALATEWGPIRVFLNENGAFKDATESLGFSKMTGLWLSISAGDFDGDGRLDLAAGNWGRNTAQEEFRARPLRLYFGDWLGRGAVDMIEARFNPSLDAWAPERSLARVGAALPFVKQRFATHLQYSESSLDDILADAPKPLRFLEAAWLESTLFLNRGSHFTAHPLPTPAQFTPVCALLTADFDGDSQEDLFLAQNYFSTRPDAGRFDAGFGLLLRGHGDGKFTPVPAAQSGIRVHGAQHGCAAADFDGDGRVDLAVSQLASPTRLFHNKLAAPGFRIVLQGPPTNPSGIGASLQLLAGDKSGPIRLSRGCAEVMSLPGATAVRVIWPGGKTQEAPLRGLNTRVAH